MFIDNQAAFPYSSDFGLLLTFPVCSLKKRENVSLFLPEFGIQDCWKNGIPNVRGMLRAPVVIGRLSLSCCLEHYKKKDVQSVHQKKKKMYKNKYVRYNMQTWQPASQCHLGERQKQ